MSYFMATAYDDNGNVVNCITGMFLEPTADYDRSSAAGSDTAINYGTYGVVPSTYHGNSGYYEVIGVDGRSAIKIHAGNMGNDTEGCLLLGTTGAYNSQTGESTVSNSRNMLNQLTDFFDQYGSDSIKMNISI